MIFEDSRVAAVPTPGWGTAMRHSVTPEGDVVQAEGPGLLHSPPALRLLPLGLFFFAAGLWVIAGAVIGSLRQGSLLGLAIGLGVGIPVAWLGLTGIRWGIAAAWGVTEVIISSQQLRVRQLRPFQQEAVVKRADFRSATVTDQFGLANELLVMTWGNEVVRVLSGRSVEELSWLSGLMVSRFCDESDTYRT